MSYRNYIFILLLSSILFPALAQSGLGTTPCNGGTAKRFVNREAHSVLRTLNVSSEEEPSSDGVLIIEPISTDSVIPYPGLEYSQGTYIIEHTPSNTADIRSEAPVDPNEIIGLEGYDAEGSEDTLRWVAATQRLAYTIYFENDPALATASASKVTITLPLHEKLNYGTFGVGGFGFGNHVFAVEGSPSSYQKRIDLRDSLGIYVDVVAGLDIVRHEAFWIFQSIDPATGLPPTDIHRGFLPINDSLHSGEGYVSFTIKPKTTMCITGDTVTAKASIVFDINEPIPTNTWLHTIDAVAPTSSMSAVPNTAGDALIASFTGQDDEGGCGIEQYKLYYSVNNNAYQLYAVYPVGDTAEIPMETGVEYRFFVLAEDHVGNCEPMKSQPEYTIGTNFVTLAVNSFPAEAGLTTGAGTYSMNATAELTATATEGYHFVNWMNQGVPVSTQNTYTVEVTQNQTYTAYFERNAYTLQTLAADGSTITVTDLNGNEVPSGSSVLHADRIVVQTSHDICYDLIGSSANGVTFISGDTLTVTGDLAISTLTNPLFASSDTFAIVCNSFDWYEHTNLTQSGDYTHNFTNEGGCDSIVTLHLTVNHSATAHEYLTICENELPYHYINGQIDTIFEVGIPELSTVNYQLSTVNGCDSIVTLHLAVNHSATANEYLTICENELPYHYINGQIDTIFEVGTPELSTVNYQLSTVNGCDSIVTLHLTVNHSATAHEYLTICENELPYHYINGQIDTIFEVGTPELSTVNYQLSTVNGCDSIVTLHLTVNHSATAHEYLTICENELPYHYINGQIDTIFEVGTPELSTVNYQLSTVNGCDSIVTLHLTVNHSATANEYLTICENELPYHYINDQIDTIFEVGTPELSTVNYQLSTINGCDSIVTLHLTVNHLTYGDTSAVACDSLDWYGNTYTASGDYLYTLTNANGCDSIVTLHLTVNHTTYGDAAAVACNSFDWYGNTYTASGDYLHTLTNANGCDSIVTLHLTISYTAYGDTVAVACDSMEWFGNMYTASGDYPVALTNANGCDSIITLHLTVNHPSTGIDEQVVCDSLTWLDGITYYESTNAPTYALSNALGCDSVVNLHLTINESISSEFNIVTEDSCYIWNNQTYCETGDYVQTFETMYGCDSVVTLHLTITVGVNDYNGLEFKLYPNPTKDVVNIHLTVNNKQLRGVEIQVFDMYGKLLDIVNVGNTDAMNSITSNAQIDLSKYASGVYLVKAVVGGNVLAVRKVVKNR